MRKFDPLKPDHPLVTDRARCPVCLQHFLAGEEVTLVAMWPANKEEAQKGQQGRSYNCEAQAIHWNCRGEP